MADLSKVSDEELAKIAAQAQPSPTPRAKPSIEQVSDDELQAIALGKPPEAPGFLERAGSAVMSGVKTVGETVDKYTGAPARAGMYEMTRGFGGAPTFGGRVFKAGEAFGEQFGEDPSKAPTGEELAASMGADTTQRERIGVGAGSGFGLGGGFKPGEVQKPSGGLKTETRSEAETLGLPIEMAVDPLNVLPVGSAARLSGRAIGAGLRGVSKGVDVGLDATKMLGAASLADLTKGVKEGAESALKSLTNASVAKDAEKLVNVAQKHGIDVSDVDAIKFGKDSAINRLSRAKKQSIGGEKMAEQFNEKLQQVQEATVRFTDDVAKGAKPQTIEDAGKTLANTIADRRKQFFDTVDTSYQQIAKANPGLELSARAQEKILGKLDEVEELADRLFKSRQSRARATALRENIDDFIEAGGDYQTTVDLLQNLRENIFTPQLREMFNPKDIQKLKELSSTVKDGLIDSVRTSVDPQLASDLVAANKRMSKFFDDNAPLNKTINAFIDGKIGSEKVYNSLVKNGDSRTIASVRTLLEGTDELKQLQGFALDDLIARDRTGDALEFSFRRTSNTLKNRKNLERLAAFVEPDDLQEFVNLVDLGDNFGPAILNASETGMLNMLRGGVREIAAASGALSGAYNLQKGRALRSASQAARPRPPLFGPQAIGPREGFFLRIPQQISRQQQDDNRRP